MTELSLYRVNQKLDTNTATLQAAINTKEPTIIYSPSKRWFTDLERTKLQGIETNAQVNQAAFSKVKIGMDTLTAVNPSSTLELIAGDNIGLNYSMADLTVKINLIGKVPSATYADSAGFAVANGGNADTVDGKHATDFARSTHSHDDATIANIDWVKVLNKPTSFLANGGNADTVGGKHYYEFANSIHSHDNNTIVSVDWNKILNKPVMPTTLPASGGDADTVDGKHATDFAPYVHVHDNLTITNVDWSKISNKPSSLPANGGNADTIGGKDLTDIQTLINNATCDAGHLFYKPSGYQKMGNGLILQWGTADVNSKYFQINFPIAFPNVLASVTTTLVVDITNFSLRVTEQNNLYFKVNLTDITGAVKSGTINWIAIGY